MDDIREYRVASEAWPDQDFEIRATTEGLNFRGYAAVFDSPSEDLGGFRETISPGAFNQTLSELAGRSKKRPVKMFLNHNTDIVLASTHGSSPTLRLSVDERGLLADADLPDNEWGHPVRDAINRGDINSMSFGFTVVQDEWSDSRKTRRILEARLWEVSPVTAWPAYPATSASVRRLAELTDTPEDDLADAIRVLLSTDTLDDAQHATLLRAINSRYHSPAVDAELADRLARLMAKRPADIAG